MRPGLRTLLGATVVVPGLLIAIHGRQASFGEEPSRLGRLFRFGGAASNPAPPSSSAAPVPSTPAPSAPTDQPSPLLFSSTPAGGGSTSARILPQPRVSRAATESDPILTRISLVRSSDGNQFGMVLQVYADGTVLDNEGVHHVSQGDLKPLVDVLQTGELYRLKGHCGAPATDFVEQVYLVVYERSLGRLKASSFSYSGNPQGCDHAVRHLHNALETLQAKLSRGAAPAAAMAGVGAGAGAGSAPNLPASSLPAPTGPSIPLSTTP
jgi:hypothetical protein